LIARSFFKAIKKEYGKYPRKVITDGGRWYPTAIGRLGMDHEIMNGGVRSYIERWNETLKDRMRYFDKYHPCQKSDCDRNHVLYWIMANIFFYNHVRPHMTLGAKPPIEKNDWENNTNQKVFLKRIDDLLT